MKCAHCLIDKYEHKFPSDYDINQPLCKCCLGLIGRNAGIKVKFETKQCLRCDKNFLSKNGMRICQICKTLEKGRNERVSKKIIG